MNTLYQTTESHSITVRVLNLAVCMMLALMDDLMAGVRDLPVKMH